MLGFFPQLYKDELLYSGFARFHQRSGSTSYKNTIIELYGKSTMSAVIDFPSCLDLLGQKINQEPTLLIYGHTLFPYYEPYINELLAKKINDQMIYGRSDSISISLGLAASKVKGPDYLRYCPRCYFEEVDLFGEAYWHRSHQIPGVYLCSIHKELLWNSNVEYRNKPNKQRFIPLGKSCVDNGKEIIIPEEYHQSLLFIAEQSYELLNNKFTLMKFNKINKFYITILNGKNYITPSKRIRIQELIPDFIHYFPKGFLHFLNSSFGYTDEDTWLHKVLRKPKVACHPLRHLLLLFFLEKEVFNQIQENDYQINLFGSAPWPCLNKAANHYREFNILGCKITRDSKTGKPIGTFTCKDCGFTYSRKGPDVSEEDKFRIGRVKIFGPIWENKINELSLGENMSISSISSELGVDPKTTKKYLNKRLLKLTFDSNIEKKNITLEKRSMFIELSKNHPNHNRTHLRNCSPRLYNWLFHNDKEWLECNLPQKKRVYTKKSGGVDWEERDEEYLLLIIREAVVLAFEIPLIRVTKTKILQRIDLQTRFEKNVDKLPNCKKLFRFLTETVEEFQIRRIRYFGMQYKRNNNYYSVSSLKRAAGINKISNELIQYVILDEINKQGLLNNVGILP